MAAPRPWAAQPAWASRSGAPGGGRGVSLGPVPGGPHTHASSGNTLISSCPGRESHRGVNRGARHGGWAGRCILPPPRPHHHLGCRGLPAGGAPPSQHHKTRTTTTTITRRRPAPRPAGALVPGRPSRPPRPPPVRRRAQPARSSPSPAPPAAAFLIHAMSGTAGRASGSVWWGGRQGGRRGAVGGGGPECEGHGGRGKGSGRQPSGAPGSSGVRRVLRARRRTCPGPTLTRLPLRPSCEGTRYITAAGDLRRVTR